MQLTVTIYQDEDGCWVMECPAIPGCISQGASEDEALANIREAIRDCLEVRAELGLPRTLSIPAHDTVAVGTLRAPIRAARVSVDMFLAAR